MGEEVGFFKYISHTAVLRVGRLLYWQFGLFCSALSFLQGGHLRTGDY